MTHWGKRRTDSGGRRTDTVGGRTDTVGGGGGRRTDTVRKENYLIAENTSSKNVNAMSDVFFYLPTSWTLTLPSPLIFLLFFHSQQPTASSWLYFFA